MNYTLQVKGRLMDLSQPKVMGILNVTPDSFYAGSRSETDADIACRARQLMAEGADIIDIGACSTRPGSEPVSEQEEAARLRRALSIVSAEATGAVVSVDTFRPNIARMAVEEYGADIINDVGSPTVTRESMFRMVAKLGVPYVLTSWQPTLREMLLGFAREVQQLRDLGQKDIVLDPGFGFGKTLEQNHLLMAELESLEVMELPVLVGVSRKSMIYRLLGTTPEASLGGTTVLNTMALMKGASILRVHDVAAAVECIKLVKPCFSSSD